MRLAGRFQMPRRAGKEPRMRLAGRFQMPRRAGKEPRRRPLTGLRTVVVMMGAPTDTSVSGRSGDQDDA
jgi:hypothetical protein